jgi:MraZ protein
MDYFFSGSYEHQLDSKRRIRIPAKLKAMLGANYAITIGADRSLWVLPYETVAVMRKNLATLDSSDPKARAAKRHVLAMMFTPEEDPQGRLVLPRNLIEYAGIDKDIVFIGQDKYIEIWAAERYVRYDDDTSDVEIADYVNLNF